MPSNVGSADLIPSWGAKIPHASQPKGKKKRPSLCAQYFQFANPFTYMVSLNQRIKTTLYGCVRVFLVTQSCPTLGDSTDCSLPGSSVHGILQDRILEWVSRSLLRGIFSGDLPNPGIEARSPALQADSLLSEASGKPKNTGVCSLSLLQQIFLTQESNWSLLHCRQILYQLSYPRSFARYLFPPAMLQVLGWTRYLYLKGLSS